MHERVFERCALPAGDFHHLHFIVGCFFFSSFPKTITSLCTCDDDDDVIVSLLVPYKDDEPQREFSLFTQKEKKILARLFFRF